MPLKRRSFLKGLAGVAVLPLGAGRLGKPPPLPPTMPAYADGSFRQTCYRFDSVSTGDYWESGIRNNLRAVAWLGDSDAGFVTAEIVNSSVGTIAFSCSEPGNAGWLFAWHHAD